MKEEQERGRVTAIRNRRLRAVENALNLAPVLDQARREVTPLTLRGLADWLNVRNYKTVTGKVFRQQTVSNLLSVDDLLKRQAEKENQHEVAIEMALFDLRVGRGHDPEIAQSIRDKMIAESKARLTAALHEARLVGSKIRGGGR